MFEIFDLEINHFVLYSPLSGLVMCSFPVLGAAEHQVSDISGYRCYFSLLSWHLSRTQYSQFWTLDQR